MPKRSFTLFASLLLASGCTTSAPAPGSVTAEVLLRTSSSWNGDAFTHYPTGTPALSLTRIDIPPYTTLEFHCHQTLGLGYVVSGEIEVQTRAGERIIARAGDTLAEVVDLQHRGRTAALPAQLLVFEADRTAPRTKLGEDGCRTASAEPVQLATLLNLIQRRLALTEAVALHKWDRQQPVLDGQREHLIRRSVRRAAHRQGSSPERAELFFIDQMEASKLLQYSLLQQWHVQSAAPASPRRDLASQIRPELDELQRQLLTALSSFDSTLGTQCQAELAAALERRGGGAHFKHAMIRATGNLCPNS